MIDCQRLHALPIILDAISQIQPAQCDPMDILASDFENFMNHTEFDINESDEPLEIPELPDYPEDYISSHEVLDIPPDLSPIKPTSQTSQQLVANILHAVSTIPIVDRKIAENVVEVVSQDSNKRQGRYPKSSVTVTDATTTESEAPRRYNLRKKGN